MDHRLRRIGAAEEVTPAGAARGTWLQARQSGIAASEIPAILGLSPWTSAFTLYHRKLGALTEEPDSDAMSLGRYLEAWVAGRFAERHPEFDVRAAGLCRSVDRPWQLATPDRLLYEGTCRCDTDPCSCDPGPVAVLELKTDASYDGWGADGTDDIPAHYRAQVLWQCDVLGVGEARVACLFLHSRRVREYSVAYHAADINLMRTRALEFLGRMDRRDPPPVDWRPATTATLRALHPDVDDVEVEIGKQLATQYRSVNRRLAELKKRKKQHENAIRLALGNGRYAVSEGQRVAVRNKYVRKGYVVHATSIDSLVPVKQKGED